MHSVGFARAWRGAGVALRDDKAAWAALSGFFHGYASDKRYTARKQPQRPSRTESCYNLTAQLPAGKSPTISSGDWSGVGGGLNGLSWDYETCTFLVEQLGTNNVTDMFPPRPWTMSWLQQHCGQRFGVTPQPTALADRQHGFV